MFLSNALPYRELHKSKRLHKGGDSCKKESTFKALALDTVKILIQSRAFNLD